MNKFSKRRSNWTTCVVKATIKISNVFYVFGSWKEFVGSINSLKKIDLELQSLDK